MKLYAAAAALLLLVQVPQTFPPGAGGGAGFSFPYEDTTGGDYGFYNWQASEFYQYVSDGSDFDEGEISVDTSPAAINDNYLSHLIYDDGLGVTVGLQGAAGSIGGNFVQIFYESNRVNVTATVVELDVNDGDAAEVTVIATGYTLAPVAFAALGTPSNGTVSYCSDCTKATPCAGSGNGALAKRLNGAWDCD